MFHQMLVFKHYIFLFSIIAQLFCNKLLALEEVVLFLKRKNIKAQWHL